MRDVSNLCVENYYKVDPQVVELLHCITLYSISLNTYHLTFFVCLFATEVVQSPLFCERKTICVLWFKCLLWFMPKLVACFKTEHLYLNTRTRDEITFTAQPKIQSQPQLFRYGRSIFCLPHWPTFSDIFSLCLNIYSFIPFFLIPNTN